MTVVISINANASWTLVLTPETGTEKVMLAEANKGYGVKVDSEGDEDGALIIEGAGKRE